MKFADNSHTFKHVADADESNGHLCLTVRLVWDLPESSGVKHLPIGQMFSKHLPNKQTDVYDWSQCDAPRRVPA